MIESNPRLLTDRGVLKRTAHKKTWLENVEESIVTPGIREADREKWKYLVDRKNDYV